MMRAGFLRLACVVFASASMARAQEIIPHAQDRPPNPAKSPVEAVAAMTLPPGFAVEVVASEPDLVNPVSMTIDERGRFWVTESLEYPRREPGVGRDRVKILEDTDGDGRADKFTIFLEGLNIPSGIAVGHGGVWIANSPDILFVPDADLDGVPDGPPTVVCTGFGRDDTHELPNSLTWGPDGWLYGWNGVFNPSRVTSSNGKTYEFTCAVWRIHPRTREFQVWCEGTSNPWGLAINDDGEFFASACVIDHLWHLVEGAYYIRQGGPYPPHTYPAGSIVDHNHQKAAYCGIHWFDSDAYPAPYRKKLYMGNIHGNCINVDALTRSGSSYEAEACPDFLTANDAWFMPVSQKTGPDGCLYILDWYDRYHCYQDANRDPQGIDRLKGRLYRVRYKDTPRARIHLASETDGRLIELLGAENDFLRATARRLLVERHLGKGKGQDEARTPDVRGPLSKIVFDSDAGRTHRMEALWTLVSLSALGTEPLDIESCLRLARSEDPAAQVWGVHSLRYLIPRAGDRARVISELWSMVTDAVEADHPRLSPAAVRELAILYGPGTGSLSDSLALLKITASANDALIEHLAWQGLRMIVEDPAQCEALAEALSARVLPASVRVAALWPRVVDRAIDARDIDGRLLARLAQAGLTPEADSKSTSPNAVSTERQLQIKRQLLDTLTRAIRQGRLRGERLESLRDALLDHVQSLVENPSAPLNADYVELAGAWGDPRALEMLRRRITDNTAHPAARLEALEILVSKQDPLVVDVVAAVLADESAPLQLRDNLFGPLGPLESPDLAEAILKQYRTLHPQLKQRALVLLSERASWGRSLLKAIEAGVVAKGDLNLNHLRKLLASKDPEITGFIQRHWGSIREGRNERRDLVVGQMRNFLRKTPGDPRAGQQVFGKLCAQCHKIYGVGEDVGPDISLNGRNDFDQLLSNVFDPNLVIGQGYHAVSVAAKDGRILSGLLVEESPARVVLKLQGGRVATIARTEIEEMKASEISLMPEEIETQLTPQEIADLFAFLALDKPPDDPSAKRLPGAPDQKK